jgi:predicted ATP-dependent protease
MGSQGLIAVDREAKMSGKTYDKAVLIIAGYLRQAYAQDFPLSLSASLSFEQSYSGIDGDSASAAEVFALLSSLSGIPLRQDLAVTGSVNQWGEVQPIGGINEKVEGFFATCRAVGLTGRQGVVMPVQNLDGLVLRPEVIEAVRAGQFHLYPVRTIDEGLEVLTGCKAGTVEEEGTVHFLATQRLRRLAEGLRHFAAAPSASGNSGSQAEPKRDARRMQNRP